MISEFLPLKTGVEAEEPEMVHFRITISTLKPDLYAPLKSAKVLEIITLFFLGSFFMGNLCTFSPAN